MTTLGTDPGCLTVRRCAGTPRMPAERSFRWSGVEELPESRDALPIAGGERSEESHLLELGARQAEAYDGARRNVERHHSSPPAVRSSSRRRENVSASPAARAAAGASSRVARHFATAMLPPQIHSPPPLRVNRRRGKIACPGSDDRREQRTATH